MRSPWVAGAFYEGSEPTLRRQIASCYAGKLGPGERPAPTQGGPHSLLGLVVPHAGYVYSGPVAAFSYAALAEDGVRPSYVVMGPNHAGEGAPLATSRQDWKTPLGTVRLESRLCDALAKPPIEVDESAHRHEHSIEVQLPFLQDLDSGSAFVPICMAFQEYELAAEVGDLVAQVVRSGDALAIASTDFTHVGATYGRLPPRGSTSPAFARSQDGKAIERIVALDAKGFADCVARNDITMCGYGPVTALLTAVRKLGATKAKLLRYGTSSDVSGDDDTAVGYAAIAIYR